MFFFGIKLLVGTVFQIHNFYHPKYWSYVTSYLSDFYHDMLENYLMLLFQTERPGRGSWRLVPWFLPTGTKHLHIHSVFWNRARGGALL